MLIAASTLPLHRVSVEGTDVRELGPGRWIRDLSGVRRGGFTHVDLVDTYLPFAEFDEGETSSFTQALLSVGLQPVGLTLVRSSVIDPVDHEENLRLTLRALDVAAALGAPVVSIGFHRPLTAAQRRWPFWMVDQPADDRSSDNFAFAASQVQAVADVAADRGLQLSLELYEQTLIDCADGVERLMELVNRDNVGINADIGNLARAPRHDLEPWDVTFAACLPHLNFWHAKNVVRFVHPDSDLIFVQPSLLHTGTINYRKAVEMALAAGYQGPICLEHYGDDGLAQQEIGREFLLRVLQDLEVVV